MAQFLFLLLALPSVTAVEILPQDPELQLLGRNHRNDSVALFDWVATGFQFALQGNATTEPIAVDMDGETNQFAVYTSLIFANGTFGEQVLSTEFWTKPGRKTYAVPLPRSSVQVTVVKATEPFGLHAKPVKLFAIKLPQGLLPVMASNRRRQVRIDVYGDSDSAAFGVDGSAASTLECLDKMESFENFAHGWLRGVQERFARNDTDVELRVQAVSGVGVVKNAGDIGTPTLMSLPMPKIYKRTLQTVDADDYVPAAWRPDLVLVYLGSNDYTAHLINPSEEDFTGAYVGLVRSILALYPQGVPVLHVCNGETKPCAFVQAAAGSLGQVYSGTGDMGVPKAGCIGHRNTTQQTALSDYLTPVISDVVSSASD